MTSFRQTPPPSMRHPGNLPLSRQILICIAAFALIVAAGWQNYLEPDLQRLKNREQEEQLLKHAYQTKIRTAASLPLLQSQLRQAAEALQTQQQLLAHPGDRHSMLQDIAAAAQAHDLMFESVKPGKTEIVAGYSASAAGIRLSGNYHDLGRFAADLAGMPHLVVLSDLQLSARDDGVLVMEAIASSYHRRENKVDGDVDGDVLRERNTTPGGMQ